MEKVKILNTKLFLLAVYLTLFIKPQKKTNKVVYKLTTSSAEPENVIENTPEPAPSAPVLPVKPAPEVDNNTDSQDSTNKDLSKIASISSMKIHS